MTLEALLRDRNKMMKLFWIGFVSSLVFMGIGLVIIILEIVG